MSTTTESQPQRAMLSADAELGMPSQPFTATPPFFQSVLSLFSRKVFFPIFCLFRPPHWPWTPFRVNRMLRLTPDAPAVDHGLPTFGAASAGRRRFQRASHAAEQEESTASQHHGEGRVGRPERTGRHRGCRV